MAKVLIIDDCEEMREIVSDILEDEGYTVVAAEDGEAAGRCLAQDAFSVILCDLVMPLPKDERFESGESAMVGVHVLHLLSKQLPQTPIVVMSGKLIGDPLHGMKSFGARAVISKPFDREELLGVLASVLEEPAISESAS
jgi:CheY-like chemotaxis protein